MFSKITEEEINYWECFHDPVAMIECLIPENIKAPHIWKDKDCKCVVLRPYQYAMLDYSYLYADDPTKSEKENFRNKKGAGDLINVGARDTGKSFLEVINNFLTLIHGEGDESLVASFDYGHLKKICQPIANLANFHPFFEIFTKPGKSSVRFVGGGMEIDTVLGHVQYGRNEKIDSPEPGASFHGIHAKKCSYEEVSYATKKGTEKRIDSGSSVGCIERMSGIPDIRMGSALGDILRDSSKRNWICRLSQYVRSDWDEKTKEEKIKEYGGEEALSYKLNVEGELIEGAFGRWDMERIQKLCLNKQRTVKFFELGKNDFADLDIEKDRPTYQQKFYERLDKKLVIEKVPSSLKIVASDIGTTGTASEVIICFGDENKLKWRYNIPLFQLTTQQQALVFKWIYEKLDKAFISIDCTNSDGRSISDELEILGVPQKNIIRPMFNKNMIVDFLLDENGQILRDDKGRPLYKQENVLDWANQELDKIFYGGLIEVPYNEKFLKEFASYFELRIGNSRKYGTSSTDHLVQSFQCMAICRFLNIKNNLSIDNQNQDSFLGGF